MLKIFTLILVLFTSSVIIHGQYNQGDMKQYLFCYVCEDNRKIKSYESDTEKQRRSIKVQYGCEIITTIPYCN